MGLHTATMPAMSCMVSVHLDCVVWFLFAQLQTTNKPHQHNGRDSARWLQLFFYRIDFRDTATGGEQVLDLFRSRWCSVRPSIFDFFRIAASSRHVVPA